MHIAKEKLLHGAFVIKQTKIPLTESRMTMPYVKPVSFSSGLVLILTLVLAFGTSVQIIYRFVLKQFSNVLPHLLRIAQHGHSCRSCLAAALLYVSFSGLTRALFSVEIHAFYWEEVFHQQLHLKIVLRTAVI